MMRSILLGGLALGSAILALEEARAHEHPGYANRPTLGTGRTDWMGDLRDNLLLTQISIPGTSESLFYEDPSGIEEDRRQSMSIEEQLRSGIRALQIVCRHENDRCTAQHLTIPNFFDRELDDLLGPVTSFLDAHPSETIVLFVTEWRGPGSGNSRSLRATLDWYWNRPDIHPFVWQRTGGVPELRDVRGKIVLVPYRVSSFTPTWGLTEHSFDIQNDRIVEHNWDLHAKWEAVRAHLEAAATRSNPYRGYVDFLSGDPLDAYVKPYFIASGHSSGGTSAPRLRTGLTTPIFANAFPDFPRLDCFLGSCSIAFEGLNVLATEHIWARGPAFVGIVMAEFPGAGLVNAIIGANRHLVALPVRQGLALRLDASDVDGLLGDGCRVGLIIRTWRDQSSHGRHFDYVGPPSGGLRCELGQAGRPGLRFRRGERDVLRSRSPIPLGSTVGRSEMTLIVAGHFQSSSTDALMLEYGRNANTHDGFYVFGHGRNPFRFRQNGLVRAAPSQTGWMGHGPGAVAVRIDTVSGVPPAYGIQLWRNGIPDQTVPVHAFYPELEHLHIGGRPALGQHWDGIYYEVLMFDRALSDAELQTIFGYLQDKWGPFAPFLPH